MDYPDLNKLHIVHYPAPVLRKQTEPLAEIHRFLDEMAARMAELIREEQGIGLAAPQVGWPFRFVLLNTTLEPGGEQAFVNPVIIRREGRILEQEGCLSVPGVFAKVRRAEKVRVRATQLNGAEVELEAEGIAARAWQHELDHLDGMLFMDRLGPAAKILIAGKLRDLRHAYEGQDYSAKRRYAAKHEPSSNKPAPRRLAGKPDAET